MTVEDGVGVGLLPPPRDCVVVVEEVGFGVSPRGVGLASGFGSGFGSGAGVGSGFFGSGFPPDGVVVVLDDFPPELSFELRPLV